MSKSFGSRRRMRGGCGPAGVLPGFEIVEQADNPVDVGVLVVETVEGAGEAHRVARIIALVELLAACEGRDCRVEGEAEQFDARPGIGVGRLEIGRDVGRRGPVELGVGGHRNEPAGTQDLDDLAHPHEHPGIHHANGPQRHRGRGHDAGGTWCGIGFARPEAGAAKLGVLDQLGQHALYMQMRSILVAFAIAKARPERRVDAAYLANERAYRDLYNRVVVRIRNRSYGLADYTDLTAPADAGHYFGALSSWSIWPVYLGLIVAYALALLSGLLT